VLAQGRFQAQGGGDHRLPVCYPEGLLAVHTGAERGEFMIEERLVDPLEPVAGSLNGNGVAQMRESHARPRPVQDVLDQPRAHRIAEHVAEDREEMAVLLNRKTFEAALPHMAVTVVVPMVAADVAGHPPLHERAQGRNSRGLHDQMKMIGHQAEAEYLDGMPGFGSGEQVEKGGVVASLVEDRRAPVSTIQHMVGVSSDVSTRNPRHGKTTGRQTGGWRQGKVACPLFLPRKIAIWRGIHTRIQKSHLTSRVILISLGFPKHRFRLLKQAQEQGMSERRTKLLAIHEHQKAIRGITMKMVQRCNLFQQIFINRQVIQVALILRQAVQVALVQIEGSTDGGI
jgi:hypothetical protein